MKDSQTIIPVQIKELESVGSVNSGVNNILDSKIDTELPWSRNLILSGLAVVLLGVLSIVHSKKKKGGLFKSASNQNDLKVLQSVSVGPKKHISSIQWQGKSYLVGITEAGISLISSASIDQKNVETQPQSFEAALNTESNKPSVTVNTNHSNIVSNDTSVADRIKQKIGALPITADILNKSAAFKKWPITPSGKSSGDKSFVVNYDSENGFIKE